RSMGPLSCSRYFCPMTILSKSNMMSSFVSIPLCGHPLTLQLAIGPIYAPSQMAPSLRGDINPEPSSFYPLPGPGQVGDIVLPVQNLEGTTAYDVVNIEIVPLIVPLVDISDQAAFPYTIQFLDPYYEPACKISIRVFHLIFVVDNGFGKFYYPMQDYYPN